MNVWQTIEAWAEHEGEGDWGHSSTRTVFFENRLLFDYGHHYLTGYRGDNVTFINGNRYSATTVQHMDHALHTARYRQRVVAMPDGVDITDLWRVFRYVGGAGGLPCYQIDRDRVRKWARANVLKALTETREVLSFFRMSRSYESIRREADREAASEAKRDARYRVIRLRAAVTHYLSVSESQTVIWAASVSAAGLREESAAMLEAMRFAEGRYSDRTVGYIRSLRRAVRAAA